MASPLSLRIFQNNVESIVIGAQSGLYLNQHWERMINYNRYEGEKKPITFSEAWDFIPYLTKIFSENTAKTIAKAVETYTEPVSTALVLYFTYETASKVLPYASRIGTIRSNFFQDYKAVFIVGTAALIALNAITLLQHLTNKKLSDVSLGMNKFLIVVWHITPYLMIVTNIALVMIKATYNSTEAWVTLAVTGMTLLETTSWKPPSFDWYLNTGVAIPLDLLAMHYDPKNLLTRFVMFVIDGKLTLLWDLSHRQIA